MSDSRCIKCTAAIDQSSPVGVVEDDLYCENCLDYSMFRAVPIVEGEKMLWAVVAPYENIEQSSIH